MNTRLKQIRKNEKLSQEAFGEKIFLSQDQISLLERGKRTVTDRTINDICREYGVNKNWLLTGEGDMYDDCFKSISIDDDVKEITNILYELDESDRDAILEMIKIFKRKTQSKN